MWSKEGRGLSMATGLSPAPGGVGSPPGGTGRDHRLMHHASASEEHSVLHPKLGLRVHKKCHLLPQFSKGVLIFKGPCHHSARAPRGRRSATPVAGLAAVWGLQQKGWFL